MWSSGKLGRGIPDLASDLFASAEHTGDNQSSSTFKTEAHLPCWKERRFIWSPGPTSALTLTPQRSADDCAQHRDDRAAAALAIWGTAADPGRTWVETYLNSRGLDLGDDLPGGVLRRHPGIGAMVALFRDIRSDEARAVSRTFLDKDARKIERKVLGPVGGCGIKLDADDAVLGSLHIADRVETCMAARQLGSRPVWACGSASAIASLPVLVKALRVIVDHDESGVDEKAAGVAEARWFAAGREVNLLCSDVPGDFNNVLMGVA